MKENEQTEVEDKKMQKKSKRKIETNEKKDLFNCSREFL